MEQVALAVTAFKPFLLFRVNTSDNDKTVLNVTINVSTIVMLTETEIPFSLPKTNSNASED
jgi:hypothetical protein